MPANASYKHAGAAQVPAHHGQKRLAQHKGDDIIDGNCKKRGSKQHGNMHGKQPASAAGQASQPATGHSTGAPAACTPTPRHRQAARLPPAIC